MIADAAHSALIPIGARAGIILNRRDQACLADINSQQVHVLFRQYGMVLFRGFSVEPAQFDAFTRRFTQSYFFGYGRAPFAGFPAITSVNETQLPLEPHCDNGIRPEPQRPDITWFLCERPADSDGETTFFDGLSVWTALSQATRDLLSQKRIRFISTYAEAAWRKMGYTDPAAFAKFVESVAGTPRQIRADGAVEVEVLSSAVRTPRFCEGQAFISSLCLAGAPGFEAMRVTLEGENDLPSALRQEIRAALADCCELVRWQAGDVLMLDNTRFLHGRRGFTDPQRRLYLIQTLRANF